MICINKIVTMKLIDEAYSPSFCIIRLKLGLEK